MIHWVGRYRIFEASKQKWGARNGVQVQGLCGKHPSSIVCVLSVCAMHVLLHRMVRRPRRVRRLISAGVWPVVSVYALAVWRCVGPAGARWQ